MLRSFAVNVLAQGLARVVSIGANLFLIIAVARVMGAESFGAFTYVLAFSAIAVAFSDLGTTSVLARGLATHHGEARARYLGNFLLLRLLMVVVISIASSLIAWFGATELRWALLAITLGLPVMASRFFEPVYQVCGRPWLSLSSNLAFGLAQIALACAVLIKTDLSLLALTLGLVASNLIYCLIAVWSMTRLIKPVMRLDPAVMKSILVIAAPVGVASIFTTLSSRADIIILEHLRSLEEVGLYGSVYRILEIAIIATVTVITPLIPLLSRAIAEDRALALAHGRTIMSAALCCAVPCAAVMFVHAEALLALLFGENFVEGAPALRIHALNLVLIVLTLLGSSINLANGCVNHGYWNTALAAAISISLNLWLIPEFGIIAAAYASVVAQTLMLLVVNYYMLKGFGNVYVGSVALKLLPLTVLCFVLLHLTAPMGVVLSALGMGLAYALACYMAGLLPVHLLTEVIAARRRRKGL